MTVTPPIPSTTTPFRRRNGVVPLSKVLEAKRLLDEGRLSRRAIATRVGLGRGTVNAIANGERGLHGAGGDAGDDRDDEPHGPTLAISIEPERCPSCGCLVYTPCAVCAARRHAETRRQTGAVARRAA